MSSIQEQFEDACRNDFAVFTMLEADCSLKEIIVHLLKDKATIMEAFRNVDAIRPRKIIQSDGKVFIWRCPDHMVPTV